MPVPWLNLKVLLAIASVLIALEKKTFFSSAREPLSPRKGPPKTQLTGKGPFYIYLGSCLTGLFIYLFRHTTTSTMHTVAFDIEVIMTRIEILWQGDGKDKDGCKWSKTKLSAAAADRHCAHQQSVKG